MKSWFTAKEKTMEPEVDEFRKAMDDLAEATRKAAEMERVERMKRAKDAFMAGSTTAVVSPPSSYGGSPISHAGKVNVIFDRSIFEYKFNILGTEYSQSAIIQMHKLLVQLGIDPDPSDINELQRLIMKEQENA